jgi:protein arginine N-methyltransferase 5
LRSEAALQQEIAWAAHLGLSGLLLPPPRQIGGQFCTLCCARARRFALFAAAGAFAACVPRPIDADAATPADTGDASWRAWNQLRVLCDHHKNLYPVLELTAELPTDAAALERWFGEPVQVLILPTSIFLANRHGFPVLPKAHQSFVVRMAAHRVQLVISGPTRTDKGGMYAYHEYVRHLLKRNAGNESANDPFDAPYRDVLQAPLQPLQDNLESQTYETFERDPVKYNQYEEAVRKALLVHAPDATRTVVLMVVGAGRGPLVRASFRAAKAANRRLRVYAVEKNPNAVVTLMAQRESRRPSGASASRWCRPTCACGRRPNWPTFW